MTYKNIFGVQTKKQVDRVVYLNYHFEEKINGSVSGYFKVDKENKLMGLETIFKFSDAANGVVYFVVQAGTLKDPMQSNEYDIYIDPVVHD